MPELSPEALAAIEDTNPPKVHSTPRGFPRKSPYDRITIFKPEERKDWSWQPPRR